MENCIGNEKHDNINDNLLNIRDPEISDLFYIKECYLNYLWNVNSDIYHIFKSSSDLEELRDKLYSYLELCERKLFDIDNELPVLEKDVIRESIKVFRNIIAPVNEYRTGVSALDCLWKIANNCQDTLNVNIEPGFVLEFIYLFKAISGKSGIYTEKKIPDFLKLKGRDAAFVRTEILDENANMINEYFKKYPSGLDEEIIKSRVKNSSRILKYFNSSGYEWSDYKWHLKHIINKPEDVYNLLELTKEQKEAIEKAEKNSIPFGITPYYLSLMDYQISNNCDSAIRSQVIPPLNYVDLMSSGKLDKSDFDFMGELDTSPVELVTRRYPMIAVMKPYNTCAQICVYCQRNWEIKGCMEPDALASFVSIKNALKWFDEHICIGEVLLTGGDPVVMEDDMIEYILGELSAKKHIYRIRIGTRTPVVLPQRWTDKLVNIIGKFHEPGRREIAIMTHFVHPSEITPEALFAVRKIRLKGMGVYNQSVFNIENSRRFESGKLRHDLRLIGVDPYYNFNMKGKKETSDYMVPIARILQERKEEARLLPGLTRTDEPVFNVPKLGKNHMRAWQNHDVIMILPDGSRVYQFHPWEKNTTLAPAYDYIDVPIYNYLLKLKKRGEDLKEYKTIWFYY